MPHSNYTTRATTRTAGSGSEFIVTKEVPYASTIDATTGGFHTIIQSDWGHPNRVEDLRHITLRNIGNTNISFSPNIVAGPSPMISPFLIRSPTLTKGFWFIVVF